MSAPPSFMQGLLQSLQPWMTGANPSALDNSTAQYGGTNGLLDALMQGAGPDTTQARQGAALERARGLALQQAAQRQGLAQGALGTQLMASKIPAIQAYYRMLSGMMGANGDQGAQGAPGAASGAPMSQAPPQNGAAPTGAPASQGASPIPQQTGAQGTPPPMGASPSGPAGRPGAPGGFWSNPLGVMRFGTLGAALGLPGGQQFADYGKTAIQYDPATATNMALAKDPLTLDRAEMADAQQRQDPQGYLSAYTKMLTDANRLHISSMSGNVTGFGLPPWVTQSMTNYNPQTGKITANGRQGLIPGAADTEAALAAAREGAEAAAKTANTPQNIPTGGGGSRFGYPGDIIGLPPALRAQGAAASTPRAPTAQGGTSPAAVATPQGSKGDVWSTVPQLDVPKNVGEADYFTKGRLEGAGKADIELASKLSDESATADQQLEYNREAMQELPAADVGPLSEWLTHTRSALIEAGVPDSLIPKSGTVTPTLELNKSLKNAALQGARQLYGSRMTQTEVKLQTDEMSPSAAMMRDAIASLMQQNNVRLMYAKAKAADYVIYRQHGGDPTRYESWYATKFPIQQFARSASMTPDQLRALAQQQGAAQ